MTRCKISTLAEVRPNRSKNSAEGRTGDLVCQRGVLPQVRCRVAVAAYVAACSVPMTHPGPQRLRRAGCSWEQRAVRVLHTPGLLDQGAPHNRSSCRRKQRGVSGVGDTRENVQQRERAHTCQLLGGIHTLSYKELVQLESVDERAWVAAWRGACSTRLRPERGQERARAARHAPRGSVAAC